MAKMTLFPSSDGDSCPHDPWNGPKIDENDRFWVIFGPLFDPFWPFGPIWPKGVQIVRYAIDGVALLAILAPLEKGVKKVVPKDRYLTPFPLISDLNDPF